VCKQGLETGVDGWFAIQFVDSLPASQPALTEHQRGQQGVGLMACLQHLRDQGLFDLTACLNGRPASWSWQADEATAGKIWCESLTETRPELSEDERVQQGAGYAACLRGLRKRGWLRSLLNRLARRHRRA
jgi:hypothetical protein